MSPRPLPDDTTVERYMEHYLPRAINKRADLLGDLHVVVQLSIAGPEGGEWTLAARERRVLVERGRADRPGLTLACTGADWLALVGGKLNPVFAFATGRIRITGDWSLAYRLGSLIQKGIEEAARERRENGPGEEPPGER